MPEVPSPVYDGFPATDSPIDNAIVVVVFVRTTTHLYQPLPASEIEAVTPLELITTPVERLKNPECVVDPSNSPKRTSVLVLAFANTLNV
jgi:hypothetical protein